MNCHYCQKECLPYLSHNSEVIAYWCDDCEKYTSVTTEKDCVRCNKKFKYHYDHLIHGNNYIQQCIKCICKEMTARIDDLFSDPKNLALFREEATRALIGLRKQNQWRGGQIAVPLNKETE